MKIPNAVIIEPIPEKNWMFGSSQIDLEIKVESGDWTIYLPSNERQSKIYETMACTNFASCSDIEILFTRLIKLGKISVSGLEWLNNNGYIDENGFINFSDRFDAIVSGTNSNYGNGLSTVAEGKRKFGLIPEKMFPYPESKSEYYDKSKITPEMYALGLEFLKRFPINYETVYYKDFKEALKYSPISTALFAWNDKNGDVYYESGQKINHAICLIKPLTYWKIYDSYDPFQKLLADDYNFLGYGIRYILREIIINEKKTMLERKKGEDKVFLCLNGKSYWIRTGEDFENLKSAQPLIVNWEDVKVVDELSIAWDGQKIIGSQPNKNTILQAITLLFKNLFGKK